MRYPVVTITNRLCQVPDIGAYAGGVRDEVTGGSPFDVVLVAASLGGVHALSRLVSALPADFPAPVLVVQHRSPAAPDLLAGILRRVAAMAVTDAKPGPLRRSTVHVLPPRGGYLFDRHGELSAAEVTRHPADDLVISAAQRFGRRACAVVLTGTGSDGASGLRAVKAAGGATLAQSPGEARAPGMPTAAAATGCVDLVLPLRVLAPALVSLVMAPGAAPMFNLPPRPWAELAVS